MQHANEIDHRTGARHHFGQHRRVVHVGIDDIDGGQQDQVFDELTIARRHAHAQAARGQQMNDMAPDKTAAADHTDVVEFHGRLSQK